MEGGELANTEKDLERRRNPAVNGVCDEYPVTLMKVKNGLQRIGSNPITFENAFPPRKQALLLQSQIKYVEDIIVTRDTEKFGCQGSR